LIIKKMNNRKILITLIAFSFLFFFSTGNILFAKDEVGVKTCAECHEDLAKSFTANPHNAVDTEKLADSFSCTECHGNLKKHLENGEEGNIFAFKSNDPAPQKNKSCLKCHKDSKSRFTASGHGKASMDCTSCHTIHNKNKNPKQFLLKSSSMGTCFNCHEDVFARFKLNEHHKLKEGILSCNDCHDPHEPATRERLGGFKDQKCFKCHKLKEGPYLYEHAAVQVEGCATCHEVHGSPNRHLLKNQRVADLCYGCHTVRPGWHATFPNAHNTNCATCHSAIHGSNLSSKFTK